MMQPVWTPEEQKIIDEVSRDLRSLYGDNLHSVILFGSRARGAALPDSDFDVLVVLRQFTDFWRELKRIQDISWRVSYDHDRVVSAFPSLATDYDAGGSPFLVNIRREGVRVA